MRTGSRWFMVILSLCLALGNGCRTRAAYRGGFASASAIDIPQTERIEDGVPMTEPTSTGADFSTNATDRLMVYDATIHMVVEDMASALDRLQAMATAAKGYMQEKTENSISLRIPAGQFNNAIRQVETLGEVVNQEIKGSDVTEEMKDLDIRLKNLEEMRARLLKLADKGDKVEDLLKVEKELERVTESLELLKGRIQYLRHAIAYSTLKVFLNAPVPQKELQNIVPFAWVRDLGSDVILSTAANFVPERHLFPWLHHFFAWLKMELPASYLKVFEAKGITRAMSGNGVMILIQREKNFEGGTLAFWTQTIHRWLAAGKVFAIADEKDITLDTGVPGRWLSAVKTLGHDKYQYLLAAVVTEDYVYTFECWGPVDPITKDRESLEKAARSMRIKP